MCACAVYTWDNERVSSDPPTTRTDFPACNAVTASTWAAMHAAPLIQPAGDRPRRGLPRVDSSWKNRHMDAAPTGNNDMTALQRAAELAADMTRPVGPADAGLTWPSAAPGGSPLDAALNDALAAIRHTLTQAAAVDIAAADQQQATLADLARREQEGRL